MAEKKNLGKTTGNESLNPQNYTGMSLERLREGAKDKLSNRFENPKPTILPADYSKKVKGDTPIVNFEKKMAALVSQTNRVFPRAEGVSFDRAKNILREGFKTLLNEQAKKFISEGGENENLAVIPELLKYFIGQQGRLDLRKGILLVGNPGSGKTTLFRLLRDFVNTIEYEHRKFSIVEIADIDIDISIEGDLSPLKKYKKGVYCFDDIGIENDSKIYGTTTDLVPRILLMRSSLMQRTGLVTHATSNRSIKRLCEKYNSSRIESRIKGMFNEVILTGLDKRI